MTRSLAKYICLLGVPLVLVSCGGEGSGWERVLTDKMFPYGNQRTAGSGVAYVLAKMMPEKDLNLASVAAEGSDVAGLMKAVERTIEPLAIKTEAAAPVSANSVQKALQKSLRK